MTAPVVLITGALAGIGRATALAFARQAARLVVSGRNADAGATLVHELAALDVEAEFVRADVRHEPDAHARCPASAVSTWPPTTRAPKASPARSPSRRPRATPPRSTPRR